MNNLTGSITDESANIVLTTDAIKSKPMLVGDQGTLLTEGRFYLHSCEAF